MTKQTLITRIAILAVAFASGAAFGQAQPAPAAPTPELSGTVVKTKQGTVQGFVANDVAVFRGLPFAAAPVGDLRWREPAPPAKWQGTRAANAYGSSCQASEDCLYLNIYEPKDASANSKLPVMVWIHGGAFIFGSGQQYDGTQFAKQGVIVVTVNYRLGRAGWFAHPALTAEELGSRFRGNDAAGASRRLLGNYGLMDQVAALKWVRDNIAAFGGDPKNVTIFGESAGAISVNYLMLAPQAKHLFVRAIAESGFGRLAAMPLHTTDGTRSVENIGSDFATKNGIAGNDAAAAKALRALTFAQLTAGVGGVGSADQTLPLADGKMITGSAYEGFAKGAELEIPYLVGGNSDEASLTRRGMNASERLAAITNRRDEFLAAFAPDKASDADRTMARLVTDVSISEPDRALARLHSKRAPTYVYHFSYVPAANRAAMFGLPHGGEIGYVFNTPRANSAFDDEGKAIAGAANRYWAQFGKNGDPGKAGGPTWPKFDTADEALLEFPAGGVPTVQKHFHKDRLDWVEASLGH
jgi:para-nitrobenzyl esterase